MNTLLRNVRCVTNVVSNALVKPGNFVVPARTAAFKSDLKIVWVRPPPIKMWRPEKSCDGGLDFGITPQHYVNYFDKSKELEDANDIVKKMFTLEFARNTEIRNKHREATLALVKRHKADRGSMESRIACMTAEILYLQQYMPHHPGDNITKIFLINLIAKRKKFLTHLRRWDYKRFEWILEKLNLVYKPYPMCWRRISRKDAMRALTKMHCNRIKHQKMIAYQNELEEEQKVFFADKVAKLEFIRSEEIACGKEPTVTEEDIAEAKAKAESVMKVRGANRLERGANRLERGANRLERGAKRLLSE